jgi:hypothetical protein
MRTGDGWRVSSATGELAAEEDLWLVLRAETFFSIAGYLDSVR